MQEERENKYWFKEKNEPIWREHKNIIKKDILTGDICANYINQLKIGRNTGKK